ncbi:hypothetical protein OSB04_018425 [Centaurea solstitialis]|uniref:Storage protein n=1 Tax=Centaurea solstitialis TaxID=347529 RepID=A0AA38TGM9_9ASTR|nr:hypothetical protein OSB04_018425 [Centaurea solstitialis]
MKPEEYKRRGSLGRRKPNDCMRAIVTIIVGIVFGFFIGVSFPVFSPPKLKLIPPIDTYLGDKNSGRSTQTILNVISVTRDNVTTGTQKLDDPSEIFVSTNPRGAERLPPAIIASQSDFYPRRLFGRPSEDLKIKPKYLVTFTVGYNQKDNIDQAVKKFSENFTILLFHYDGRTTEWDEFEWSKRAIHISIPKQTKWWYAKRFLHPDIVAPYDYIFIWDEDLGVEHFDAEEYIKLVRKHKLEISQPGLDPSSKGLTWQMTKRREDVEVHKETEEKPGWCSDPHLPPCAASYHHSVDFNGQTAFLTEGVQDMNLTSYRVLPLFDDKGSYDFNGQTVILTEGVQDMSFTSYLLFPLFDDKGQISNFTAGFKWDDYELQDTESYDLFARNTMVKLNLRGHRADFNGQTVNLTLTSYRLPSLFNDKGFVEIMAPVFSRDAWRCVWHLIQNDLVHGWGLDFALRKCIEPAYERIGVVDAQWIVHQGVPSLGNQVRDRCKKEWRIFQDRVANAEKAYYKSVGVGSTDQEANWVTDDRIQ